MKRLLDVDLNNRDELVVAMPRLLIVAGELSARAGEHLIFRKFDLTIPQYSLLATLAEHSGTPSMTELREANFIMVSPSSITGLVDDLEARGLVKRLPSPSDRRVSLMEITDAGRQLLDQVNQHYQLTMREYAYEYDTANLRIMVSELVRFIEQCVAVLGIGEPHSSPRKTE